MPYIKKVIFLIALSFVQKALMAQNNFSSLSESALAINNKVSKKYSIYLAFASRSILYNNQFKYIQQQLNVLHFSTFKLNYNSNISFGVNYRNRDWFETGSDELRFTEQFNYTKQQSIIRYGHRFRAEQRIFDTETTYRQRYRFAIDFPLNGSKLDIGEAYLINGIESLLSITESKKPDTDLRLSTHIGWQITEILKLQIGLEHRLESFNRNTQNNLFALSSAILKI